MKFLRKHIWLTHIFLFIFFGAVCSIAWFAGDWFLAGSVETWGPAHSFGFICLSIFIAVVAALNAINATSLASDTQRPFLSVDNCLVHWQQADVNKPAIANQIEIQIENTGVFPSNDTTFTLTTTNLNSIEQKSSYTLKKGSTSIVFPSQSKGLTFVRTEGEKILEIQPNSNDQLLIEITITYKNHLSTKNCKTIQGYKTDFPNSSTFSFPKHDYWD